MRWVGVCNYGKHETRRVMAKALTGDQQAWQRLYELFASRVYQFFLRNTRNADLAADKTQEVFLKSSETAKTSGMVR